MSWTPGWFQKVPRLWASLVFLFCVLPGAVDAWMSLTGHFGELWLGLGSPLLSLVWALAAVVGAVYLALIYRQAAEQAEAGVAGSGVRSADVDETERVLAAEQEARRMEEALRAILEALPQAETKILQILLAGPTELAGGESTQGLLKAGFVEKLYEGREGVATYRLTAAGKTVVRAYFERP